MTRLPRVSGRAGKYTVCKCARALEKVGFYFKRQEGSHIIMRRDDPFSQVVVPDHRELAGKYTVSNRGTLRAIIQSAGLSVDEFVTLL
jgi:predicted RNA binding protein YcfA (HicA-like mRNA interferase family)